MAQCHRRSLMNPAILLILQLLILIGPHSTFSFTPHQLVRSRNTHKDFKTSLSAKGSDKLGVSAGPTSGIHLIGTGSSTPKTYISNSDLEDVVETSDEWIMTRTGIGGRRVLLHEGEEVSSRYNIGSYFLSNLSPPPSHSPPSVQSPVDKPSKCPR